jgi:hypothetical protein
MRKRALTKPSKSSEHRNRCRGLEADCTFSGVALSFLQDRYKDETLSLSDHYCFSSSRCSDDKTEVQGIYKQLRGCETPLRHAWPLGCSKRQQPLGRLESFPDSMKAESATEVFKQAARLFKIYALFVNSYGTTWFQMFSQLILRQSGPSIRVREFPDTKARIEHIWNVSRIPNLKSIAACLKLAVSSQRKKNEWPND